MVRGRAAVGSAGISQLLPPREPPAGGSRPHRSMSTMMETPTKISSCAHALRSPDSSFPKSWRDLGSTRRSNFTTQPRRRSRSLATTSGELRMAAAPSRGELTSQRRRPSLQARPTQCVTHKSALHSAPSVIILPVPFSTTVTMSSCSSAKPVTCSWTPLALSDPIRGLHGLFAATRELPLTTRWCESLMSTTAFRIGAIRLAPMQQTASGSFDRGTTFRTAGSIPRSARSRDHPPHHQPRYPPRLPPWHPLRHPLRHQLWNQQLLPRSPQQLLQLPHLPSAQRRLQRRVRRLAPQRFQQGFRLRRVTVLEPVRRLMVILTRRAIRSSLSSSS
mmetsp:Transcript_13452/g.34485  ORF Transcript_13452/g.34485 Transcript_13452/m.34485 type:complete len:333 (+) Transcript_13452:1310-2308(+)